MSFWGRVTCSYLPHNLTLFKLYEGAFWKHGEIRRCSISHFPTMFLPFQRHVWVLNKLLSANSLILKFCRVVYWTRDYTIPTFNKLDKKPFENIVEKRENAGIQHFLLFPQCFLPFPKQISMFHSHWFCRLQILWIWKRLRICRFSKELKR